MKALLIGLATIVVLAASTRTAFTQSKAPSPADIAKAAEAAKQRAMQQFDTNRDGVLSPQERAAAEQAAMQSLPLSPGMPVGNNPQLRQFDRDGDGRLSAPEIRLARELAERMRKSGGTPQRGFTPGAPSAPPASAPAAEAKPEKTSPLVKRFDKDGDGKLNEEEKAAAQAELKGKKKDKGDKGKDDKENPVNAKDKPAEKADK